VSSLNVLGLDPSLRNWGMAACTLVDGVLTVIDVHITKTANIKDRKVKQNVSDIQAANQLYKGMLKAVEWADVICIEVPHGSQSSRAMVSYGVCVALIAIIQELNPNIVQVSANDVKAIVRTNKEHKPSKQDVIAWVRNKHPEAPLPFTLVAEHMCDAIVAVYAAMLKPQFKEMTCTTVTK